MPLVTDVQVDSDAGKAANWNVPRNSGNTGKRFKAIAAMSENRVIGRGNQIPWHLQADFQWFKQMTSGHIIVMGRRTFESIGKPLPNRTTLVLSRCFEFPGVQTISQLSDIDLNNETREVFICGGAQVYAHALPLCSDLFLTRVKRVVDGDAYFPVFEDRFDLVGDILVTPEFRVQHYRNHACK